MSKEHLHFLSSEIENTLANKAFFHVIPVPFEYSVSYGTGTQKGPQAILEASDQLELYENYTQSSPALAGIHTQAPIKGTEPEIMLENLTKATAFAIDSNAIPVILGGEHSISYGALRALKEKHGTFGILHIDAHADLRESYESSIWSHASAMKRALDLGLSIVQFGTRAYCEEELNTRKEYGITAYDAHLFADSSTFVPYGIDKEDILPKDFPKKVYISFDVDGLDPSIIPHTGTPVPGGLAWYQSLNLLKFCLQGRELIGFDVVELAPNKNSQVSDFACANLVYKIMGLAKS